MITRIGTGLIILSAIIYTAFVVVYSFVDWWRSEMGRNVMGLMAVIAAVTTLWMLRVMFDPLGEAAWFQWLRVAVFAGVPAFGGWRLWMLIKIQFLQPDPGPAVRTSDDETRRSAP